VVGAEHAVCRHILKTGSLHKSFNRAVAKMEEDTDHVTLCMRQLWR
jgi:hypothetical protein